MQLELFSFIAVVFIGALCSLSGWLMMRKMKRTAANSSVATGKVVHVTFEIAITGPAVYYPVIEFTTESGTVIRKKYPVGDAQKRYEVGDELDVIYNKEDPEDFILKGNPAATFAVLFFFLGIILIAFACAKYF